MINLNTMKKKCMNALVLILVTSSTSVVADAIHTGSDKGSYYTSFCPAIKTAIQKEYFNHECKISMGTADNIKRVRNTPTDIGIGQIDLTSGVQDLEIIDADLGMECLYAVTKDKSIRTLFNLSNRIPIALPGEGSGSVESFKKLQALDEGLTSLRNINNYESAYEVVKKVVSDEAALGFFVQYPDTTNEVFKLIYEQDLSFVPVISRKILRQESNGIKLYEPLNVKVTPRGIASIVKGEFPTIQTSCTKIVLFTGKADGLEGVAKSDQVALIESLAATKLPEKSELSIIYDNLNSMGEKAISGLLKQLDSLNRKSIQ